MANEKSVEMRLPSLDELFSSQEERDDAKLKRIYEIPLEEIDPFPDHPFKVQDDEDMMNLAESIRTNGILTPATVRKKEDGRYELLSGHRRLRACQIAGIPTLRCEIVEMSLDEAINMIREFAPEAILSTARQIKAFKCPDGGMSAGITHCQTSVYGSPAAMPGSDEGNVNGSSCASSALVSGVYHGLDLVDVKVPLYTDEDFKKYVSILEERENNWKKYGIK